MVPTYKLAFRRRSVLGTARCEIDRSTPALDDSAEAESIT